MEAASEQSGGLVLIGSGNVAWALGAAIQNTQGIYVRAVVSKNPQSGEQLAAALGCTYSLHFQKSWLPDYTLLCVPDQAISVVSSQLSGFHTGMVLHCSGSISVDVLSHHQATGVLYPIQTFHNKARANWDHNTPLLIEAKPGRKELNQVSHLAQLLSTDVHIVKSEKRFYYHMAAVILNNFVNHIAGLTQEFCSEHKLNEALLKPLVNKTVEMFQEYKATEVQTGPAKRNDSEVVNKHIRILQESNPDLAHIYECIARSIMKKHSGKQGLK